MKASPQPARNPLRAFTSGPATAEVRVEAGQEPAAKLTAVSPASVQLSPRDQPDSSSRQLAIIDPKVQTALDAVLAESDAADPNTVIKKQELVAGYLRLKENEGRERDSYIDNGYIFRSLWRTLSREEYRRFVNSRVLVSLGENGAFKLRHIVEKMTEHNVPREAMPRAWTVAYHLMSMKDDLFNRAMDAGLLRPDVTEADLREFKNSIGTMKPIRTGRSGEELERLQRERDELVAQQRKLRADMMRLARRLKLIRATLEAEAE